MISEALEMVNKSREQKINELRVRYQEFRGISFPKYPTNFLFLENLAEWDATIAGIVTSYLNHNEKCISTPLSIHQMLNRYNKETKENYLNYKPLTLEDKERFNNLVGYKKKLDELVKIITELEE